MLSVRPSEDFRTANRNYRGAMLGKDFLNPRFTRKSLQDAWMASEREFRAGFLTLAKISEDLRGYFSERIPLHCLAVNIANFLGCLSCELE